jgi:hypothetical protein
MSSPKSMGTKNIFSFFFELIIFLIIFNFIVQKKKLYFQSIMIFFFNYIASLMKFVSIFLSNFIYISRLI